MADKLDETIDNAMPDKPATTPASEPAAAKKPESPAVAPPADDDDDLEDKPAATAKPAAAEVPSPAADAKPEPFGPHEQKFADRLMEHLEQNHPAIKHLCGEHKKYMDSQAAMAQPKPAAASATNGNMPGDKKKPKDDDKPKPKFSARIDMSQTAEERLNYAETRLAKLEEENAILYANEALDALERQGKVIKDKPREVAKLVAMSTLEERQAHLADIKLNYADAERSPARRSSWLPVADGHPEGAKTPAEAKPVETSEILAYAMEHSIDISTEAGIEKAVTAMRKQSA